MQIYPIQGPITVDKLPGATIETKTSGPSFAESLKNSIAKVDDKHKKAEQAITDLAVGRSTRIHETMMAMEEADLSFKMLSTVRNKALDAYREIMRMSV
jgi:flagellar hook-basal body complex protein FliE